MSKEALANDIWRACDIMRRDNNCGGVMEYLEHLSWVLFLKFLDEEEGVFEAEAVLKGRNYTRILEGKYRWSAWVPKALGKKLRNGRRGSPVWDGDELMRFVRGELIPHLASLAGSPEREVVAGVFSDRNVIVCASPYNLKDILAVVDEVDFKNPDDIHTVSHVYEGLLQKLGNENKLAGEFYTPRAVIRFVVQVVDPRIGETVYDPACGSCGFLAEAFEHMREHERTRKDHETLQRRTFFGQEKKSVPALLGLLNLVLHGVLTPTVRRRNTLEENIRNVSERFDVVLTNPPFGGTENQQIQQNFPVKSNATELLFIEHIMKKLKATDGARCGMVVPEGTLFRTGAFATVKQDLLETFDLSFVVSLPPGTFAPYADVKTALLFFERPGPTKEVLYYELPLPVNLKKFSKGAPISDIHFDEAREVWGRWNTYRAGNGPRPEMNERAWIESKEALVRRGCDVSAKNPNQAQGERTAAPTELTAMLLERSREVGSILEDLNATCAREDSAFEESFERTSYRAPWMRLGDVAVALNGRASGEGESTVRVFKTRHVYPHTLRMARPSFLKQEQVSKIPHDRFLRCGDVLMANIAEGTLGRMTYVAFAEENWTVDTQIMILRSLDESRLLGKWLYYFLSSGRGQREILARRSGIAFADKRGQTHIYPRNVLEIPVPVPPIERQREILGCLDAVQQRSAEARELLDQKIGLLARLGQSVLEHAFRAEE
ncbi:MAG: N-6 DNA methylase [Deltaproteobacteria bacterium]|nr:N-6 DNA methylase [Deltaproteobacteria bacterium]